MKDANSLINISDYLSNGGIGAIILLMLLMLIGLLWERFRLIKKNEVADKSLLENKEKELESIKQIIDRYHEGNRNLGSTLAEIKIVLESIQRK